MKIIIPGDVLWILRKLNEAGHEAYVVGGCVRDSLLGRTPNDWDITTSAEPMEVKALFRRTIDTGLQHGTVTVMNHGTGYEVTTYRVDGDYSDHRRPESVTFSKNLADDLMRRDFTINAMAYHPEQGLVDLYDGMKDMAEQVIRAVGEPDARFDEDALRILRAVRFAAQLGFSIEAATRAAIRNHVDDLEHVSVERIETELTKLICSPHPEEMEELYDLGITARILPEFDWMMETPQNTPYHYTDVGHHTIAVMQHVSPTKVMRYAALLHDVGKPVCRATDASGVDHFKKHPIVGEPIAREILKRLKLDNKTIENACRLVLWHDFGLKGDLTEAGFRRGMSKMGIEHFPEYLEIRKADTAGQSDYRQAEKQEVLDHVIRMYEKTLEEKAPLAIRDLAVGGQDLKTVGVPAGPVMGQVLQHLLDFVLTEPARNTKEQLLRETESFLKQLARQEEGNSGE